VIKTAPAKVKINVRIPHKMALRETFTVCELCTSVIVSFSIFV